MDFAIRSQFDKEFQCFTSQFYTRFPSLCPLKSNNENVTSPE